MRSPDWSPQPDSLSVAAWALIATILAGVIGFLAVGTLVVWSLS